MRWILLMFVFLISATVASAQCKNGFCTLSKSAQTKVIRTPAQAQHALCVPTRMPPKVVYVAVPVAMPQHGYAQWPVAQTSKTVAVRTNTAQPRAVPVPMPVAIPQSTMSPYAYQQAMQQMQQQQPQPLMTTTITFDPRTQLVTMTQTPVLAVQPPIPAVQPPAK